MAGTDRLARLARSGILGGLLVVIAVRGITWALDWPRVWDLVTNADHAIYLQQARRVLAGGPLYPAWELAGPFIPKQLPELYPPPTVYGLFVPMALLPMPLWWIVPLVAIAGVVVHHRPRGWVLVGVVTCLAMPGTWIAIAAGNPSLWAIAGVALATVRAPFAAMALVKPTLWPLALLGVRSRTWWAIVAVYAIAAGLAIPAWVDYARVLLNYRGAPPVPAETALVFMPLVAAYGGRIPGWRARIRARGR